MSCKTAAADGKTRRLVVGAATAMFASCIGAATAGADPLRLRGDALLQTEGSATPTGLVVLQGQDTQQPWVSAEGLVWAGATPSATGDVLVLAVHLREPHGYAELQAGRFVLATGAVHPVQIDGGRAIARAPWGSTVETFGGIPVVPRFGARSYDWLAGGRIAETVSDVGTLGFTGRITAALEHVIWGQTK